MSETVDISWIYIDVCNHSNGVTIYDISWYASVVLIRWGWCFLHINLQKKERNMLISLLLTSSLVVTDYDEILVRRGPRRTLLIRIALCLVDGRKACVCWSAALNAEASLRNERSPAFWKEIRASLWQPECLGLRCLGSSPIMLRGM